MKNNKTHPGLYSNLIVTNILNAGSAKDGYSEQWRDKSAMYHLIKGAAHLAQHIKGHIDPRSKNDENHLHKAMTRLAMAATIERKK